MARLLKLPEVAQRLEVSEKTARRYVKSGVLPSSFIGNAYRVSEEDVEGYLRRARVEIGDEAPKAPSRSSSEAPEDQASEERLGADESRHYDENLVADLARGLTKWLEAFEVRLKAEHEGIPLYEANGFVENRVAVKALYKRVVGAKTPGSNLREAMGELDAVYGRVFKLLGQLMDEGDEKLSREHELFSRRWAETLRDVEHASPPEVSETDVS